jgi:hypothetical protein
MLGEDESEKHSSLFLQSVNYKRNLYNIDGERDR